MSDFWTAASILAEAGGALGAVLWDRQRQRAASVAVRRSLALARVAIAEAGGAPSAPVQVVDAEIVPPRPPSVGRPAPTPTGLPGVTTLGALRFQPTPDAILLGLGPGGELLTVPAGDALCHIAFAGPTGVGKTNLMRLLLTQLIAAGLEVTLCDPHFAPVHPRTGEDWQAIAAGTVPGRAITDRAEIVTLITGLGAELDRRLAAWHAGRDPGPARFYAVEELPLLAQEDRAFMERLGRILREGRKLGLFVITAMQDALISTIGGSSGLRSQFQTVYFGGNPGTDPTTARALLGSAKLPPAPGKGIVWLRSAATGGDPRLVRVPLVENGDIAWLLGPPPVGYPMATAPPVVDAPFVAKVKPIEATVADSSAAIEAYLAFLAGDDAAKITEARTGIDSSKGGAFQKANRDTQQLIREGMQAFLAQRVEG